MSQVSMRSMNLRYFLEIGKEGEKDELITMTENWFSKPILMDFEKKLFVGKKIEFMNLLESS